MRNLYNHEKGCSNHPQRTALVITRINNLHKNTNRNEGLIKEFRQCEECFKEGKK